MSPAKAKGPGYWQRPLLNGRTEVYWSDGETCVHLFGQTERVVEVVQSLRDLHGGGPSEPHMRKPRYGKAKPASPHPGQTAMTV